MFAICSAMADLPSAYPLRDLFDAAVRHYSIKLTCGRCSRVTIYHAAALWWLFEQKGWADRFSDVQKRCLCLMCFHRGRIKVRFPTLELTRDPPTDTSLPMPTELDWKRELRRKRSRKGNVR
jgi:hypothetical protein